MQVVLGNSVAMGPVNASAKAFMVPNDVLIEKSMWYNNAYYDEWVCCIVNSKFHCCMGQGLIPYSSCFVITVPRVHDETIEKVGATHA